MIPGFARTSGKSSRSANLLTSRGYIAKRASGGVPIGFHWTPPPQNVPTGIDYRFELVRACHLSNKGAIQKKVAKAVVDVKLNSELQVLADTKLQRTFHRT